MQEELVKYETALLAREKGFSEEVTYAYDENKKPYHRNYIPHDYNIRGLLSAPTQSLLAKWLRDRKKVDIEISCHTFSNTPTLRYIGTIVCSMPVSDENWHDDDWLGTYEAALEDALIESLKML